MSRFNPSGIGKDAIDSILAKLNSLETNILARLDNLETGGGTTPTPTVPSNITNLQASNITEASLTLTWTASSVATSYDIERNGTNIGNVTGTSYNATGLTAGTTYTFSVKAKNDVGSASGVNIQITTVTPSTNPPETISNLTVSDVAQTTLMLSWTASSGATSYDVERNGMFLTNVFTNNHFVTNLEPQTTYTFTIYSRNSVGTSSGVSITITTDINPISNEQIYAWVGGVE